MICIIVSILVLRRGELTLGKIMSAFIITLCITMTCWFTGLTIAYYETEKSPNTDIVQQSFKIVEKEHNQFGVFRLKNSYSGNKTYVVFVDLGQTVKILVEDVMMIREDRDNCVLQLMKTPKKENTKFKLYSQIEYYVLRTPEDLEIPIVRDVKKFFMK